MKTVQVNMHEAKSRLSQLGENAWSGIKIVIAKSGKPYLDLLPHKETCKPRKPGRYQGQIRISKHFDQTSDDFIDTFEGKL